VPQASTIEPATEPATEPSAEATPEPSTEPATEAAPEPARGRRAAPASFASEDGPVEGTVVDIEALVDEPELIEEAVAAEPLVLGASGKRAVDSIPVGKTPGVTAEDLHAEAGRKVLRFQLARMIDREPGTRDGKDPEELHSMRVATRRMRAAWRVFGDGFQPGRTKKFRRRLQLVAARLGTVRDLDVLMAATEAFAMTLPTGERSGLQPLVDSWRADRDAGRSLLMRELDSAGHRRFVEAYRDFVMTPGADVLPVGPTVPHRVRDTAGSRITLAYEQVRAYETVLRWADVPTLHELRIAAKRLRYTLEFVREALGPEAPALIGRVVALQDHLGAMNDAEVATHMARAFLVDHAGDLTDVQTAAISRYLVAREREVARWKRTVGVPWRRVSGLTFRRALGRTIAAL
jgi:CHAD domain-containing protein